MKTNAKQDRPSKILPRPWGDAPKIEDVEGYRTNPRKTLKKKREGKRRTEAVRDASWLDRVRKIPRCVVCKVYCKVEAAHRDEGKGMNQKTDDVATAALCPACHLEIGNGKNHDRENRRNLMNAAIVDTLIAMARMGEV